MSTVTEDSTSSTARDQRVQRWVDKRPLGCVFGCVPRPVLSLGPETMSKCSFCGGLMWSVSHDM